MNEQQRQPRPIAPDPLIEDVRRVRVALSEQFGNDVRRLCEYLRQLESQFPERIATPRRSRDRGSP
jgi:hypothetical protein